MSFKKKLKIFLWAVVMFCAYTVLGTLILMGVAEISTNPDTIVFVGGALIIMLHIAVLIVTMYIGRKVLPPKF